MFVGAEGEKQFDMGLNFLLRTPGWEADIKFNKFLKESFDLPFSA